MKNAMKQIQWSDAGPREKPGGSRIGFTLILLKKKKTGAIDILQFGAAWFNLRLLGLGGAVHSTEFHMKLSVSSIRKTLFKDHSQPPSSIQLIVGCYDIDQPITLLQSVLLPLFSHFSDSLWPPPLLPVTCSLHIQFPLISSDPPLSLHPINHHHCLDSRGFTILHSLNPIFSHWWHHLGSKH